MKKWLIQSVLSAVMSVMFMLAMVPAALAAPANDNFADAKAVTALPYSDPQDYTGASNESDEPTPSCAPLDGTIWYAYTPDKAIWVSTYLESDGTADNSLTVYTGPSLGSLSEIGCRYLSSASNKLVFQAVAGMTYYFQANADYNVAISPVLTFHLDGAVEVDFTYAPPDPSIFEQVNFEGSSGLPVTSWSWDFGDGATGDTQSVSHQYSKDGDYTVNLTVNISGGGSASVTKTVPVKTHDVAITKFTAPSTGKLYQTRPLTVCVKNNRYVEKVAVMVYKDHLLFGTLEQQVPVEQASTCFNFSYTFTTDDAAMRKVVFSTEARIVGARDAFLPDNMAIAKSTKVNK